MTTLVSAETIAPPVISAPAAAQGATSHDKGLRAGALGLISSVVIAVSSTAPAYSMAATLGLIVAVVGVHSPGTLIASFLPMLCIAYAFRELNKVDPDCGTTFTWTARAFGPRAGWMGGWGLIAADVIVMASLAQIAGRYFMQLVGLQGAGTVWVTVAGVAFIALLTGVCYRGIEVSARLQQALLIIEVGALAVFAVVALVKAGTGHALPGAAHPTAAWLSPWTGSFGSLSNSFLLAVFIYWGWDCCLSVNEETKDSARPGPRRGHGHADAGRDLRRGQRGRPDLRRPRVPGLAQHRRARRHGHLRAGQRARQAAGPVRADLHGRVLPDHDHADRARRPGHVRTRRDPPLVRPDAPAVPHADHRDPGHGRDLGPVLRAADRHVEERAGRLGRVGRPADRLLLRADRVRLRLVLPPLAAGQRAGPGHQGDPADDRRADPARRVRPVGQVVLARRQQLLQLRRNRGYLPDRCWFPRRGSDHYGGYRPVPAPVLR